MMRAAIRAKVDANCPRRRRCCGARATPRWWRTPPHDAVWGVGPNGDGTNLLGKTFMALREEMNE